MKAEVGLEINHRNQEKQMKRAPKDFEDDDSDGGDVEERKQGDQRLEQNRYQNDERQGRGAGTDQRGAERHQRSASGMLYY